MTDICPQCKEHCEFEKRDENGDPMDEQDDFFDDTPFTSDCCGAEV